MDSRKEIKRLCIYWYYTNRLMLGFSITLGILHWVHNYVRSLRLLIIKWGNKDNGYLISICAFQYSPEKLTVAFNPNLQVP